MVTMGCLSNQQKNESAQTQATIQAVNHEADAGVIVEMAPFTIKVSTTEQALIEVSNNMQNEFLAKQKGYISRSLVRTGEREYLDIIHWQSQTLADAAIENAMKSEACAAFFSVMEAPDTIESEEGIVHYPVISRF